MYRRFQITFDSSTAAFQFIDSIRKVCPCKLNNAPQTVRNIAPNISEPPYQGQGQIQSQQFVSSVPLHTQLPTQELRTSRWPDIPSLPHLSSSTHNAPQTVQTVAPNTSEPSHQGQNLQGQISSQQFVTPVPLHTQVPTPEPQTSRGPAMLHDTPGSQQLPSSTFSLSSFQTARISSPLNVSSSPQPTHTSSNLTGRFQTQSMRPFILLPHSALFILS